MNGDKGRNDNNVRLSVFQLTNDITYDVNS